MFHFFRDRKTGLAVQSIAQADEVRSLADPAEWLLDLFGATPALSGVAVSPATAMRCTAVRAAVEAISEGIGGLPLHVYEREGDARERAPDHPAYAVLHDQANDWTPASLFREQVTRDALLHGNGFAFVNRQEGQPRELIRLRPEAVTVELDRITSEPLYRLSEGSQQRFLDRRDVLHIAAPSIDGISGASPVTQCREAIALAIVMERHAARLFGRGGRPSGLLKFPQRLGAETAKRIKQSWQAAHAGENSGGTAVLEEGGEFQALTLNSVDSQFQQLWQHSILEICRVFRVPPHLVFELGRATWGNAAEMGATFLRFTLMRWIKAWEGEIRLKLIAPEDRARFYAEFLADDLLRADLAARADAYGKLIAARVLNPNEVRAMENRAAYAGGDTFLNPNTTAGGGNA
ncbi:phage portal protein [Mesorhizobium sp. WSM2239]|uniref:Phage portal protein n=2 Tax=unclassified Mesorhizobium TaxID=325217 RepID=A0AAU8D618_9HYPH